MPYHYKITLELIALAILYFIYHIICKIGDNRKKITEKQKKINKARSNAKLIVKNLSDDRLAESEVFNSLCNYNPGLDRDLLLEIVKTEIQQSKVK